MLRVPLEGLESGERMLDEATARYVTRVHRLQRGDRFLAFDPAASTEAVVELLATGPQVRATVGDVGPAGNVPQRAITVIQAAGKGTKIEDVLRDATELGVTRFVVAIGERSVRRPEPSHVARWRRVAIEASRQCGRGDVPEIEGPMPLAEALRTDGDIRWLLEPRGRHVSSVALEASESVVVAIGPEGGFSPGELDLASRTGFEQVRLGRFVMRTETACSAILGAIEAVAGDGE